MILTKDNYKIYAAKYYDNPGCLTEDEFEDDLKLASTIMRMLSWYNGGVAVNIKILINNVIMFYNVFSDHTAASKLLEFKIENESLHPLINAILYVLRYPLIGNKTYFDNDLYITILKEIKING